MQPDLELVLVRDDQSFKIWSHGYPFRTVRWHFHPEYELHLVTATTGDRYVGDHIGPFAEGDLVFVGPNLPHNWISHVADEQVVEERCLVLQFTGAFIERCMATFPELRPLAGLLAEAVRGVRFEPLLSEQIGPLMRTLLQAQGPQRIAAFMTILDLVSGAEQRTLLASPRFQPNSSAYLSSTMNAVLQHIGCNFTGGLCETDLANLAGQSVSTFSRSFRRHTGMTFVQYVNALRIELACQHLTHAALSVTEICFEVGFNNVSNFNRQFLAVKGMPPSKFRSLRRDRGRLATAA